ncbi:hypothetical protein P7C73_g2289, partial [Tremellales sp. Uapishka_1]
MSGISLRSGNSVTFTNVSPSHSSPSICIANSSPSGAPVSSSSSSTGRPDLIPLGPAKLLASSRRAVIFSPRNDTKYFNSSDSILPANLPPSSIRSYAEDSASSAYDTPLGSRTSTNFPTPSCSSDVKSILKSRYHQIRVASTVEEGTMNNKEAARLLVTGTRPTLIPRDSFQLTVMRKAAETNGRKDGEKVDDTVGALPASLDRGEEEEEDEEVEEIEEGDRAMDTTSLVNIILDGAEDLLTLEEAYSMLTVRLRQYIPLSAKLDTPLSQREQDAIRLTTLPIREEGPAMVRALQRDLHRLLGKVPNSEVLSDDRESSPFRGLMPGDASANRARFTPSPSPVLAAGKQVLGPPPKQGYSESEVRYRRESSGVGAAALRFLAFTLHSHHLYSCYSDVDLTALLDSVMIIPRTPRLPTPNPKRTYFLSIVVLAQLQIPAQCVLPIKDKVVRAVESALNDSLGSASSPGPGGKEGPSQTRKEGFHAIVNLVSTYPFVFFQHYADLLAPCLRGMISQSPIQRHKASAAAAAFATAKLVLQASRPAEVYAKNRALIQKFEYFVVAHLKSFRKSVAYSATGEKKTEWMAMEQVFKDTVGSQGEVHWACASWAVVVTLIGATYGTSGMAMGLDHIIDRSVQPSSNTLRPLLARTAWNHAIHAYLSSGSVASMSEFEVLVQSFKPFTASSHQTPTERVKTIQTTVELALQHANSPANFSQILVTMPQFSNQERYTWQRAEKPKKLQWLETSGFGAAAIVYAYTGMALTHEDQPAREMEKLTGLPSSDGAPQPDGSIEEQKVQRLDVTFEKVVQPMLKGFMAIHGIDRLKVHGWEILQAMTTTWETPTWNLDRLLSKTYLSGELFAAEKGPADYLADLAKESVGPSEIPSWGSVWIARRLGRLLDLFHEAVLGLKGINDISAVDWIQVGAGATVLPLVLSNVWRNMLQALKTVVPSTPLYITGLNAIASFLVALFEKDPSTYIPICLMGRQGCSLDVDEIRISIVSHLFDVTIEILGEEAVGGMRIRIPRSTLDTISFGSDQNGHPTMAGSLLGHLLRSDVLSLRDTSRAAFKGLISRLLDVGCVAGFSGKLLGDITNKMPWIFEDAEKVQLDVWRLLATKWTAVIDLQPSASTSTTNHTGHLLVSLLSGPFRSRSLTAVWHQSASQEDLDIWRNLLKAAVLRSRAKKAGSNIEILETLAAHLGDFCEEAEKTLSTTITISCLATTVQWIQFVESQLSHNAHYYNVNSIPVEFLTLVSNCLVQSYPTPETQAEGETVVSPALNDLMTSLTRMFESLPNEFVLGVLEPCRQGLELWLSDELKVADERLAAQLDELYVSLITALSKSVSPTSNALDLYIDLYAPRLSLARSTAVPRAFQEFWIGSFAGIQGLEYSDDVAGFLRSIMSAIPGFINVEDLSMETLESKEEASAVFPHTESLISLPKVEEPVPQPPTSMEYDADVSHRTETQEDHIVPSSALSDAGTEDTDVIDVSGLDDDVFGPAAMTQQKPKTKRAKKGSKKARASKRIKAASEMKAVSGKRRSRTASVEDGSSLSQPALVPDTPLLNEDVHDPCPAGQVSDTLEDANLPMEVTRLPVAETPLLAPDSPLIADSDEQYASDTDTMYHSPPPPPKPSILESAGRWFSRVSSFTAGQHNSPSRDTQRLSRAGSAVSDGTGRGRLVPIAELPRKTSSQEMVSEDDQAAGEELAALNKSPRKRKRMEEVTVAERPGSPLVKGPAEEESLPSGVFDDAPEPSLRVAEPNPEVTRMTDQDRLLASLRNAAELENVVGEMDLDGLSAIMEYADKLKVAATSALLRMANNAEGERRAKRARGE